MDTPTPIVPEPPAQRGLRLGAIIRDVVIIFVLTAVGGFVVGVVAANKSPSALLAIALSNFVFGTIGFIISGCLAKGGRWRHLAWVGVGVWLAGLVNVFAFGFSIVNWMLSIIAVAIMMGLGGGLSYFFAARTSR